MSPGSITSWQIDGETVETVADFIFLSSKITADVDCSHEVKRCLLLGRKVMTNLDSILKSRDFVNKGPSSQGYGFSSGHVWMWELGYKENGAPKNWCFWTMVLEKTLESPLDCKEIQPVHPKGDQSWIFIGRTDVEARTPILWPPDSFERPWCWVRLRAGGEGDNRGWDGWMASLTQWTWVWVNSRSWWWTGSPGMLHGFTKVRHNWVTFTFTFFYNTTDQKHQFFSTHLSLYSNSHIHTWLLEKP